MKNNDWRSEKTELLIKGLLLLENSTEAANFLRDLMTPKEIDIFSSRLQAAKLLEQGDMSYRQIAKETGMSTTTITRINEWLKNGMDGYKAVLSKVDHHPNGSASL